MGEVHIRIQGRAGRITLTRPAALNALSHPMCLAIAQALRDWRDDPEVALILIDAEGERAFCAGGDIADIYRSGLRGDHDHARRFWADEYRMNAALRHYPKPIVSLMQGFTMGGGVGLGCHVAHRVVGESTQVSMPECGIGLIPDVGGTYLLARAPGRLGAYLGTTGARMGPGDAIHAGFADHFVAQAQWEALVAALARTGDAGCVADFAATPPEAQLADLQGQIDRLFAGATVPAIQTALAEDDSAFAAATAKVIARQSPLSLCCTLEMLRRLGRDATMEEALAQEYRFTFRAQPQSDFQEGIRAAIIDKDRTPRWMHATPADVPAQAVEDMLAPLGADEWIPEERT